MQIQTGEIRRAMDGGKGVAPRRPGLMDARLKILDALARVLTFGRWVRENAIDCKRNVMA